MAISLKYILKHSAKFNLVQLVAKTAAFLQTIIVASILVPSDYGIIGILNLWLIYSGLINPGVFSAAKREIPYFLGKADQDSLNKIRNLGITSEIISSALVFTALLCCSFLYGSGTLRTGLRIIALIYAVSRIVLIWSGINLCMKKYTLVARATLMHSLISTVVIVLTVYWLKVYALLAGPLVGEIACALYLLKRGRFKFHLDFDFREMRKLARTGIVLSLAGLVYMGFRLVDRTVISSMMTLEDLGLYSFAMAFVYNGIKLLTDFSFVLTPVIYEESGRWKNRNAVFSDLKRVSVYLAVLSGVIITLSQAGFYVLVRGITVKYVSSTGIFFILSFNLFLVTHSTVPNIVLQSKLVDRPGRMTLYYIAGICCNAVLDIVAVLQGWGITGIAWATVITQGLLTLGLFVAIRNHLCRNRKEFFGFMLMIWFPFLIALLFYGIHSSLISRFPGIMEFFCISLVFQTVTWFLAILALYRDYFSREKILMVIRKVLKRMPKLSKILDNNYPI